jgi:hypothetical protein
MAAFVTRNFEEFCALLSVSVGMPVELLKNCDRMVADLGLDELSLASMLWTVETLNPYFYLNEQIDILDMTLRDLHHFYTVMSEGHMG